MGGGVVYYTSLCIVLYSLFVLLCIVYCTPYMYSQEFILTYCTVFVLNYFLYVLANTTCTS
jgi:hypothetical protein